MPKFFSNATRNQKLGWVLFVIYLVFLGYFMFFSESFGRTEADRAYAYNLVPLREISRYFRYYERLGLVLFLINIVGNVAAFVPFGFFLPVIAHRARRWTVTAAAGLLFSFSLETMQLLGRVGSFDVDDMLLNTLGALSGYGAYTLVQHLRVRMRKGR